MTPLFEKLQLGTHAVLHVLDAPAAFEAELAALDGVAVRRTLDGPADFALAFVVTRAELDRASRALAHACAGDAVLWMAYPKKSSKRYRCEFDRDTGWDALGEAGFEPVRMVAIDADWTALRFRRVEHIRTMARDPRRTISEAGKRRTAGSAS